MLPELRLGAMVALAAVANIGRLARPEVAPSGARTPLEAGCGRTGKAGLRGARGSTAFRGCGAGDWGVHASSEAMCRGDSVAVEAAGAAEETALRPAGEAWRLGPESTPNGRGSCWPAAPASPATCWARRPGCSFARASLSSTSASCNFPCKELTSTSRSSAAVLICCRSSWHWRRSAPLASASASQSRRRSERAWCCCWEAALAWESASQSRRGSERAWCWCWEAASTSASRSRTPSERAR
mmetsp:Transcript_58748/g.171939  ORF Transcript_58748/g.171939 Transcript_58748/m.171939 type:complete len:242 (+) Transcript_58748:302-1027(+)